ncbi:MAG: hypothetical protein AAF827_08940 [Cyanobacteria bacterium P01_D01_bin.6]
MHQAAIDFFQLLIQAGAIPGQDFSCDAEQQAYHLNQRCYNLLSQAFPHVDWQEILGDPDAATEQRIAALHQALGCDFVERLMALMVRRLATLPDGEAIGYLQAILVGVESATDIALFPFLQGALDLAGQARLEWLLRQAAAAVPGDACLVDLLQAAGATAQDYTVESNEIWLTESGWQRLSLVWDGECALGISWQR